METLLVLGGTSGIGVNRVTLGILIGARRSGACADGNQCARGQDCTEGHLAIRRNIWLAKVPIDGESAETAVSCVIKPASSGLTVSGSAS
jgi:hypothetical protein